MGRVLEVFDPDLGRRVAVKLLRSDEPSAIERMLREARAQARVDHPNVARIYQVGELHGKPFISMQLIDGKPLDEAVADLPLERRLALLVPVVRAVQAAHAAGLVHRDLKPGNILVERRADGELVPFVLDFGIAREVAGTGLTLSGQIIGTPGYMSPEQGRGEVRSIDRRSDVFSLGVLLYELVAGAHPFDTGSAMSTLMRILESDPPPLPRHLPRDLRVIVERCLEKDRERRYPSAKALGDDLERYLAGEPVAARPIGSVERLMRRMRRHPVATTLVGGAVAVALLSAGFAVASWWRASEQARTAEAFGRRIERIDNVMRLAHISPLHDLTPERALVEAELAAIRDELDRSGRGARGPAFYALGRGALSLERPEEARRHLEAAVAAGFEEPRVRLALGRTFLALLARELSQAERLASPEDRREARRRAHETYGSRARDLLSVRGARSEDTALLRAQLALADDDLEAARRLGLEAAAEVPWRYEGLLLAAEADLRKAGGILDSSLPEEVVEPLARAREVLDQAVTRAPSDPQVYAARCRWWRLELDRRFRQSDGVAEAFEGGVQSCDDALLADREHVEALSTRAQLGWRYGRWLRAHGKDPAAPLAVADESAERLLGGGEGQAYGYLHRGNVAITRAEWAQDRGEHTRSRELLREAIGHLESAARLRPDPLVAMNLGRAWSKLAGASWNGDWEQAFREAVGAFQDGLALGAGSRLDLLVGLCATQGDWAYVAMQHGREPGEHTELAIAACREALAIDPEQRNALNSMAMAYWCRAEELLGRGEPAETALAETAASFRAVLERYPNYHSAHVNLATALLQLADVRISAGRNAEALLDEAAGHSQSIRDVYPTDYWYHQTLLHTARARNAIVLGRPGDAEAAFAAARQAAGTLIAQWGEVPVNLVAVAAVDRHAAGWHLARGERERAHQLARSAGSRADEALEHSDRLVAAWIEKALAAALAARAASDPNDGREHWREAREAALRGQALAFGPRPELAAIFEAAASAAS